MVLQALHPWDIDTRAARDLQDRLRSQVRLVPFHTDIRLVAGADVAVDKRERRAFAAVVVLSFPDLVAVEQQSVSATLSFPYVPGLLSFREGPAVLECFRKIGRAPDVLLVDGQGVAHPRRIGLASHLGLWLGIPTVGCAKSRLIGDYVEPGPERGDWSPLTDGGETIGAVLRTRARVRPLFASPGHLVDLESSIRIVLACTRVVRLPEPTRLAHQAVTRFKREFLSGLTTEVPRE